MRSLTSGKHTDLKVSFFCIGTFTSSQYGCDGHGTSKRKGRMRGPAPGLALLHRSKIQNRMEADQGQWGGEFGLWAFFFYFIFSICIAPESKPPLSEQTGLSCTEMLFKQLGIPFSWRGSRWEEGRVSFPLFVKASKQTKHIHSTLVCNQYFQ